MKRLYTITILCLTAALAHPASAQNMVYENQDAQQLQNCLETVRDINSDPENQQPVSGNMCIGVASNACQNEGPQSQTTIGMANCTVRETAWWDELLNNHYAQLRTELADEEFSRLRDAQRAWITFKEADCDMQYFYWREGTIRSIIGTSCSLQHTAERALDLGEMLDWFNN